MSTPPPPPSPSPEARAAAGVEPLRVDGALRHYLAVDPTPQRRVELARTLLSHWAAEEALEVLPAQGADALRWAATRQLGSGRPEVPPGELASRGVGEDAFLVAIHAGQEAAAEQIAARTPGAEGERLRAELSLRRGQAPSGPLDPLNALRRDFMRGALRAVADRAGAVEGRGREEAGLLGAAAHRRLGNLPEAHARLGEVEASAESVLPGIPLEQVAQRLQETRLVLRGATDCDALSWALGQPPALWTWWPTLRRLRQGIQALDLALGPFRGEVLSRCVDGQIMPISTASAPRSRAARLRSSLRVQPLEEVVARLDRLAARTGDALLTPMYAAELLHWYGQHEAAGARCDRVRQADPYSRWSWIGLTQAQLWTGDLRGAQRTLRALKRRHPKLPTIPALAGELALRGGAPGRAVPSLRQAIRLHPTRWSAHVLLALALLRAGQQEEAEARHARLVGAAPGAWAPAAGLEEALAAHLQSLRGNRSSGFVTRVSEAGEEQLLRPDALQRGALGLQTGGGAL